MYEKGFIGCTRMPGDEASSECPRMKCSLSYIPTYVCVPMRVYLCMSIHMCIYIYIVCMYMCVCMHTERSACMYLYISVVYAFTERVPTLPRTSKVYKATPISLGG